MNNPKIEIDKANKMNRRISPKDPYPSNIFNMV